jgi:hypothetical protein
MKARVNWDALGIGASLACAIHCAVLPLFLSSLPLFGLNIINNIYFEIGMMSVALLIGVSALLHGFLRHHHSYLPLSLFLFGFACLVLKEFWIGYARWLLLPAVLLIVGAHMLNFRLCRMHSHAHAEDCDH